MSTVRKSTFMSNAAAITAENFTLAKKLWVSLFLVKTAKVRLPPAAAAAATICKHSSFRVSLELLLLLLLLAQFALLLSERQLDKLSYHTNSIRLNESDISIISADTERRRRWCQQQLHSTRQMWPWSEKGANEQTNQSQSKREVCCCQTNTVCSKCCCKCFACSH